MPVLSTRGLNIYLENATSTPTEVTPTGISAANPAVVTVAATTGIIAGDAVEFSGTGITELDGKFFVVGTVETLTFEVYGADLTGVTTTLDATPVATVHHKTDDMERLCLSALDIQAATQNPIDVSTFCGSASILGNPTAGSITMTGFVDTDDAGYLALLDASEDGAERALLVEIPSNGVLVAQVTIGAPTWSLPLEGAAGYSFPAATAVAFRHCWDEGAS